jgi:amino acid transporter/ribosomal protein S18 acetylase RimI-like enzyme
MIRSLGPGQDVHRSLARDRLGVAAVLGCVMSAAAPLTIVAGLVSTAFAVTGVVALPAAFAVVGLVLGVFSAGYVTMSRHLPHSGALYAYVSHGLGRPAGVSAAWVSLVSYSALETALYGIVGAAVDPLISEWTGLDLPWWIAALAAWALVAVRGVLRVDLNGRILGILLVGEVIVICGYDLAWLAHPAAGLDWSLLSPAALTGPGVGSVLAIAILGFTGFETGTVLVEEAKNPRRTVPAATYLAVATVGLLYGVSSWAMAAATGTTGIADSARRLGPMLPFTLAQTDLGAGAARLGQCLFATSILAAMISFHGTTSRYLFALGRERVLPGWFERTSHRGAPKTASLAQSALAVTVILVWAAAGWDPVLSLFYLAGTSGALGVITLLLVVAVAVVGFFAADRRAESVWHTRIAPLGRDRRSRHRAGPGGVEPCGPARRPPVLTADLGRPGRLPAGRPRGLRVRTAAGPDPPTGVLNDRPWRTRRAPACLAVARVVRAANPQVTSAACGRRMGRHPTGATVTRPRILPRPTLPHGLSIMTIGPSQVASAGALAAAFFEEPVTRWLVPRTGRRQEVMARFFTQVALGAVTTGSVEALVNHDGNELAVAVWLDHTRDAPTPTPGHRPHAHDDGSTATTDDTGSVAGEVFVQGDAERWARLDAAMTAAHPVTGHEYLLFVGVHPDQRGRGLGTRLLHQHHDDLDRAGTPAYLEATSPGNRALYARLVYHEHGRPLQIPHGPVMWPMWRPARPPRPQR